MTSKTFGWKKWVAGAVAFPIILSQAPRLTADTYDVTVTDKSWREDIGEEQKITGKTKAVSNQDLIYYVHTDQGTFQVDDSFTYFNFFPDEMWGEIQKGKRYRITAIWWRFKVPFFREWSQYENIVSAEMLTDET